MVGLISSLVLKHVDLYFNPSLEFALMLCFVYIPYAFAEGIHLSGKYFLFYNLTYLVLEKKTCEIVGILLSPTTI